MHWTRRDLMGSMATLFASDVFTAKLGTGGDFAVLGYTRSWPDEIELPKLMGEWKDESWSRAYWRFDPGPTPDEYLVTRIHRDHQKDHFRGVLVHPQGENDFLVLTPPAAQVPGEVAPRLILKVKLLRVVALSVGTPRKMRIEFSHHPTKFFHRLHLIPMKPSGLRDLDDTPKLEFTDNPGPFGQDVRITANAIQTVDFLAKHGGDASCWKGSHDMLKLVQRLPDKAD